MRPLFKMSDGKHHVFYKDSGRKNKCMRFEIKKSGTYAIDVVYEDGSEVEPVSTTKPLYHVIFEGERVCGPLECASAKKPLQFGVRVEEVSRKHREMRFRVRAKSANNEFLSPPLEIRSKLKKRKWSEVKEEKKKRSDELVRLQDRVRSLESQVARMEKEIREKDACMEVFERELAKCDVVDLSDHTLAHDWFECGLSLRELATY